jgi:hypothetical protein
MTQSTAGQEYVDYTKEKWNVSPSAKLSFPWNGMRSLVTVNKTLTLSTNLADVSNLVGLRMAGPNRH